jgi:hypothetical protein
MFYPVLLFFFTLLISSGEYKPPGKNKEGKKMRTLIFHGFHKIPRSKANVSLHLYTVSQFREQLSKKKYRKQYPEKAPE